LLYRCIFIDSFSEHEGLKFDNFLQKLFKLQSDLLLKGELKPLPRCVFASFLFYHDSYLKKYSPSNIVYVALRDCMQLFGYTDAQLRVWISSVVIDYNKRNLVHGASIASFDHVSNNTNLVPYINMLNDKYNEVYCMKLLMVLNLVYILNACRLYWN
jgi:hypothetical protein